MIEFRGYTFEKQMRLLPLALAPGAGKTILHWRPFADGDTLDSIIEAHNEMCIKRCEGADWHRKYVGKFVEIISAVDSDLSTISNLKPEELRDVRIFLADLEALEGLEAQERLLDDIRTNMLMISPSDSLHLAQIAKTASAMSLRGRFRNLPIGDEYMLTDQEQLEQFLDTLCKCKFLRRAPEPSPINGNPQTERANGIYVDRLSEIAGRFRDDAMSGVLSEEEATTLATASATQEMYLAHIAEQVRPDSEYTVFVNPVRERITGDWLEFYSQQPEVRPVDLVEINPSLPLREMTEQQRNLMGELGILNDTSAAVHFDQSSLQETVRGLGNAIEMNPFSADLPSWT